MIMHYKHRMNDGRDPQEKAQEEIEQCLYRLAAEQDCNWRKEKGDYVKHAVIRISPGKV